MRSWKYLLCALLGWSVGSGAVSLPAPDEVTWLDNYGDAVREARQTRKPIFLEFRCEA